MGAKPSKKGDLATAVKVHDTAPPPAESAESTYPAPVAPAHAKVDSKTNLLAPCSPEAEVREVADVPRDDCWTVSPNTLNLAGSGSMSSASKEVSCQLASSQKSCASTADTELPRPPFYFVSSLDEIAAQVGESFGQDVLSLQSSKWDKRAQALKTVGSVLRSLKLDATSKATDALHLLNITQCFETSCLLLHLAMRDRVLPVLFASHELYRETIEFACGLVPEEHIRYAMDVLFEHLTEKLGDSNIRLHESARAVVLLSAEQPCFGLEVVLQRLLSHMNIDDAVPQKAYAKTMSGILDTVSFLLQHFPGRCEDEGEEEDAISTWTPSEISPFVVHGLQTSAGLPRVKTGAVNLAVAMYATLGMLAVQPLLASLRPAMQNFLRQKFEESECECLIMEGDAVDGEDCDFDFKGDLDGLVISGVGLKAPPAAAKTHATVLTDREESLMDDILEETGLVFDGGGSIPTEQRHALDDEIDALGIELGGDQCIGDTAMEQKQVATAPDLGLDNLDLLEDSLDQIEISDELN